jgi:hypothetical protein
MMTHPLREQRRKSLAQRVAAFYDFGRKQGNALSDRKLEI